MIVAAICLTIATLLALTMGAIVYFRCFEDDDEEFYELPLSRATNSAPLETTQIAVSLNEKNLKSDVEDVAVPL